MKRYSGSVVFLALCFLVAVTTLRFAAGASAEGAQRKPNKEAYDVARSFPELRDRLRIGDKIFVTARDGHHLEGTIESFSWETSALTLSNAERPARSGKASDKWKSITLSQGDIRKIDLETNDPLWNGALIGFGIGTGAMLPLSYHGCEGDVACNVYLDLIGGGIGAK